MLIGDIPKFEDETADFIKYHTDEIKSLISEGRINIDLSPKDKEALDVDIIISLGEWFIERKYDYYLAVTNDTHEPFSFAEMAFIKWLYGRFFDEVDPFEVGEFIVCES